MTTDFEVAVAGTGFIGPVHVEALRRAGLRVRGILGSTPAKSRDAAAELGLAVAYDSFDDVLRDARVGAVHITTPNRFHYDMASRVLRSGRHVVCEKPLAMTSKESAELVRIAADSGKAAAVAFNIRFYPLCHEAAARVRAGDVGAVFHVSGSYVQDWLLRPTDFNWRVLADEGGALRAVADIGTHWLDLAQFVTDRTVVSVCADLKTVHPVRRRPAAGSAETFGGRGGDAGDDEPIDTEDCGGLLVRFGDDSRGSLWVSQVAAGRKNRLSFEVAGSEGSIAWDSEEPNTLWIGRRDRPNESLVRDPALLSGPARAIADYPGGHAEGFPDTFKQLFRAFYGHVAAGTAGPPPYPTFDDGHREVLLCEAVLESHRRRGWADVRESAS